MLAHQKRIIADCPTLWMPPRQKRVRKKILARFERRADQPHKRRQRYHREQTHDEVQRDRRRCPIAFLHLTPPAPFALPATAPATRKRSSPPASTRSPTHIRYPRLQIPS